VTGAHARESSRMPTTDATASPPPSERADRVFRVLQSLRTSFIRIGLVVLVCSIGGYCLAESILRLLQRLTGVRLAAFGIPETFFSYLTLGLAFGVFASMPFILYAILAGVQPLYPTFNRRMMRGFWFVAVVLFCAGVLFCLNISLPYGVKFLLDFQGPNIEALISVQKFVGFCLLFLFGFGFIFELPLAMILAGHIGVVTYQRLARNRRYAVLIITIISAVLTPTPDAFNLAMMAVPLYLLFELGLFGMRFNSAKRKAPGAVEETAKPPI
jgi:sec-independent protein translocase protein TatC